MKMVSRSENETKKFAYDLTKSLRGGQILALVGDLGSGKTTFTKGLAEGLKIKQTIHSPTFVLMRVFKIPQSRFHVSCFMFHELVHIDIYRLKDETELLEIGALDYLGQPGTITVIEWADRIKPLLKKFGKKVIWTNFDYGKKEGERIIKRSPS